MTMILLLNCLNAYSPFANFLRSYIQCRGAQKTKVYSFLAAFRRQAPLTTQYYNKFFSNNCRVLSELEYTLILSNEIHECSLCSFSSLLIIMHNEAHKAMYIILLGMHHMLHLLRYVRVLKGNTCAAVTIAI